MSTKPYTFEQIVALAKALNPVAAVQSDKIIDDYSLTPLITQVELESGTVSLDRVDTRYGAGYIRVSTDQQNADGFSVDDQIKGLINYFVTKRQAFRLYSDAGLSGSLPYNAPDLIKKLMRTKSNLYKSVFTRVFLNDARRQKYSPAQITSVKSYLQMKLDRFEQASVSDLESELHLRPKQKQTVNFRPGLSRLIEQLPHIHTLAVNDLSRLSRNQSLFKEITDQIQETNTFVIGVMDDLSFLNRRDDFGASLQAFVLGSMAEMRLRETLIGDFRGILERLEQGKPCGSIPCWIELIKEGLHKDKAKIKAGGEEAILRLVELFLDEELSIAQIGRKMVEERWTGVSKYDSWSYDTVKGILLSKALLGMSDMYGLEFPIYPKLIEQYRFDQIQLKLKNRKELVWMRTWDGQRLNEIKTNYPATSLLRCVCIGSFRKNRGGAMVFKGNKLDKFASYICGCGRRNNKITHIAIGKITVHAFIDELMMSLPISFFSQTTESYDKIKQELADVQKMIADVEIKLQHRQDELEVECVALVEGMGFSRGHANFDDILAPILKAKLDDQPLSRLLANHILTRSKLYDDLSHFQTTDVIADLQTQADKWKSLQPWEQNDVLLKVFDRWQFKQCGDDPDKLQMVLILRGGRELPAVTLTVKVSGLGYKRLLPSVQEWITSVGITQKTRQADELA